MNPAILTFPACLALTLLVALTGLTACQGKMTPDSGLSSPGRVQHIVLVWLKEPGNETARTAVIESSRGLESIPGVLAVSVGTPLPQDRDIVDSSYDVGIIITLENSAALEIYLPHPIHRAMIEEVVRPLVERYRVYDIVLE